MKTLKIGLLGCGTVGSGVLTLLHRRRDLIGALGYRVQVEGVLVRDPLKPRSFEGPDVPLTDSPHFLEGVDVVIEVMGGVERPLGMVRPALEAGRTVITANKAMLAERWEDLEPFARQGRLYYEASVMAGTPVIAPLATVARGSQPKSLRAILNGTCAYILARMEQGLGYAEALLHAQDLGYAEDPPTLDVGGFDAAHKLTVLARMLFDPTFRYADVQVQGIDALPDGVVLEARARGERVMLVGSVTPGERGWQARVAPEFVSADLPLAQVRDGRNALHLETEENGLLAIEGAGAGGLVTASAVLGDLIAYLQGVPGPLPLAAAAPLPAPAN
ncbi:homoserine dehydrogenase [Deinobacterium chartae]|uniref:Homoserine dehydrogenase n=1 Tax=Deinobacterium chartae TaxID=521158 RepID=A0A841HY59_9DEIO|nr:homoserine dehydrogenase [Deinobacterium chartae]MBB6097584.1 homoserine dehydrogenase [Deinobacterium chartae]